MFLFASIVSCSCVCVFASLHLINLAPMECRSRTETLTHNASPTIEESIYALQEPPVERRKPTSNPYKGLRRPVRGKSLLLWETNREGSGSNPYSDDDDWPQDQLINRRLEVNTGSLSSFEPKIRPDLQVNVSVCICEQRRKNWRFVLRYDNLSCAEVKNVLPIFFVASCVFTVVGGVMSSILLYMLWVSRRNPYGSYGKPQSASETRPFIYKSQFKNGFSTNGTPAHQISLR